jgi:molecular chaperone HtpG
MDEADKLMPRYLRFIKGVVDSDDLPLNVSREILQHNKKIDTIRNANIKRVLGELEKLAKNDEEKYAEFWKEFGQVMKEGPVEDFANREKVGALLRFASTQGDGDQENVSLDAYIERMKEGQEKIYYITADSLSAAKNSPHLEVFKKNGIEVLLMKDRVDEWMMSNLTEYKEKSFQSVAKGELDLSKISGVEAEETDKEAQEKAQEAHKSMVEQMKTALGEDVKEVRISSRLVDSPACLVVEEQDMSANLARVLKQIGQDAPMPKPIMEINVDHPLLNRLEAEQDDERFNELARVLFDQALLAEGGQLDDPAGFVNRMNKLMLSMAS